jgi:DNA-binding transcriptional ArsR family regulator
MIKIQNRSGATANCAIDADVCPGQRDVELPVIDEREIESSARIHKALSDPTRLKILAYLEAGELCVCELFKALDAPQSTVSHHLLVLHSSGLLKSRKQGRWVAYSINREVFDRCNPFCEKGVQTP